MSDVAYFTGLDLGQAQDYSALAVVERTRLPDPNDKDRTVNHFAVRHLRRWELGTSYPKVVEDVRQMMETDPMPGSVLAIDATGVGKAVVDLFRTAKPKIACELRAITITFGAQVNEEAERITVPKKDLVAAMQTAVQLRRFQIAPGLKDAKVLGRELQQFRVKITAAGNETFEAWRERDHDDLVLATALAVWSANKPRRRLFAG
jgi:hypothetical protein